MTFTKQFRLSLPGGKAFLSPLVLLILTAQVLPLTALTTGPGLTAVIVQFEVSQSIIRSEEAYAEAVTEAVELALAEGEADLLIFPEYLGVFAALIPWAEYLKEERPFEEVWMEIASGHPDFHSLKDLFASGNSKTERFLDKLWGDLAAENEVAILSGTRFTYDSGNKGLMNQALVYGPEGEILYRQNKYFLTEFEEDILNLSPGKIIETPGFILKDRLIRLTICRDTFLREWEKLYRDGDLWIDIKANGVAYTPDQVELFKRALPTRLPATPIPYGITACLTGSFLNLLWEGESSIIINNNREDSFASQVEYLDVSEYFDRREIMRVTFP